MANNYEFSSCQEDCWFYQDSMCSIFIFLQQIEIAKPQASRYESAEIFYICKFFKINADDKIDPKFFDPKEVFQDVAPTVVPSINLMRPQKVTNFLKIQTFFGKVDIG